MDGHRRPRQQGLDAAMVLQQHAGARAQQLGLDPIFAVQATQGALAFGGAPIGVLAWGFYDEYDFDSGYRELMVSVGERCAQALERARAIEDADRRASELRAFFAGTAFSWARSTFCTARLTAAGSLSEAPTLPGT